MFDVLVLGAGPAGAATALVLARRGLRVGLLERGRSEPRRIGETIPGIASAILRELELWEDFRKAGHDPAYALRSIWGGSEPLERNSIFDRYGPGYHLDRPAFDAWLLDHAVRAGAELTKPVRLRALERVPAGSWRLEYQIGERTLTSDARFIVDATGPSVWASRRVDASRAHAQRMIGVARWFARGEIERVTLVETAPEGWWYSAPLPSGTLVMVWMTDAESETARAGQSDELWKRCLASAPATLERWRGAPAIGDALTRATGPAITRWPPRNDFLAVGDAACRFDPMSGTGLCFALRSALDAATSIEAARTHSRAHR